MPLAQKEAPNKKYGFRSVLTFKGNEEYKGDAYKVILIWNSNQILPAEQYRKAHFSGQKVDIIVCKDPNIQKAHLGDKAIIYNL
jgi:hypothetical protein